ncbi:MAG: periplasmic heavy metal sensor [Desulfopila sp.]|jgi:Spy/CpxP family protein refolding chaperone|nr:periplasmic heavy metal sensor [Desulfopila sp.]
MKIQKALIVVALVAGLGVAGLQQASARGWNGGPCPQGYGQGYGMNYQMMDNETRDTFDAFRAETTGLRKQIAMKKAEQRALMSSQTPDPAAVSKIAGELFDLKTEMQTKAKEAGVPWMMGPRGKGGSGHYGMGRCMN